MTSLDVRSNSAVMKRAEQLKRWEESDTNRAPATPRLEHGRKIKFTSGCEFLAACLSGDKEEVVKLLENGADINTANVDGLTALHQACIDDNLDMVEFLIEHDADINRQDNEGWTPLHATASCGFVSIARFLVEHGADVAAVNSDGDLALDLAVDIQHIPMIEYLQQIVNELKIDCEKARQAEEQMMLADAKKWLRSDASEVDRPHAKTGATALHVAAAKGYSKVISLLLAGRANVDKQDNDGWTPLHAAAHWGQKEAAEMLVDALADMEIRNLAGMTCIDVADRKMVKFLEDLRAKSKRTRRRPSSQIRNSDIGELTMSKKLLRIEQNDEQKDVSKEQKTANENEQKTVKQNVITTTTTSTPTEPQVITASISIPLPKTTSITNTSTNQSDSDEAPWRRNNLVQRLRLQIPEKDTDVILRRTQSFENDKKKPFATPRATNSLAIITATTAATTATATSNTTAAAAAATTATTATATSASNNTPVRRSFAPPQRNEESETQRKAHAKRVRETRRSTQGVTLDEIKSAEELVKKTNSTVNNNNNNNTNTNNNNNNNNNSSSNKISTQKLEDANTFPPNSNSSKIIPSAPAVIAAANLNASVTQRLSNSNNNIAETSLRLNNAATTAAATNTTTTATATSTSAGSQYNALNVDKDTEDKENDSRSMLTTQAIIQRRRKPKRRSTGVVHIDMEELDSERQDSATDAEEKETSESTATTKIATITATTTVGDLNYKGMWEDVKIERDRLKQDLTKKDEELTQAKVALERLTNAATAKNSISEIEKRERRAMERKLSEMEEELKQLELYKAENQRLKEENGALIRVISKLSK